MARSRVKPHQEILTLATLGELAGGQAEATVNAALRAALRDTEDRGADKKPRKVTIDVVMSKIGNESVAVNLRAKTTVPPYQTDDTIGDLRFDERGNPQMAFSPIAPENPDQGPLPGTDGE